jgi:hypothetical protein
MMKQILACIFALILTVSYTTPAQAAALESAAPQGDDKATYSVVSAVVNREYDFVKDFHDSYPYDEDFRTLGIFELDDYNGDVTLTLKNNSTNETFVYEKTDQTEWSVKASVDHLLYETTKLDAQVHIYDLGGDYGIEEVDIPVTITVVSSQYSADAQKYPGYEGAYTAMYEGEDFTVEYDPSSPDKATVKLLKSPWLFSLSIYNVETKEAEDHDTDNSVFEFPTEAEVTDFDPSSGSFWFYLPSKLIMEDGYPFAFTMSVHGFLSKKATDDSAEKPAASDNGSVKDGATNDSAATPDSAKTSNKNDGGVKQSGGAVKTGDSVETLILAVVILLTAVFIGLYSRKRDRAR